MTSVLLKQFTEGRVSSFISKYSKIFGLKSPKQLDNVIPDITSNLFNSTQAFMDALINLDEEFISSTCTPALQTILLSEIKKAKASHLILKKVDRAKNQSNGSLKRPNIVKNNQGQEQEGKQKGWVGMFTISPYVIFGQTMEERIKVVNPWVYNYFIMGANRFINVNPSDGVSLKKIMTDHIYGFNCYYTDWDKDIEVIEGSGTKSYPAQQFVVTFQTNAENHEFYVSDFNYFVKEGF